jgi:hypothetical protein
MPGVYPGRDGKRGETAREREGERKKKRRSERERRERGREGGREGRVYPEGPRQDLDKVLSLIVRPSLHEGRCWST